MKIIDIIEQFDSNTINTSEKKTRRETLSLFGDITKKMALTAIPGALLAAIPSVSKAAGNGPAAIVDVLNFALTLEYLEASYYNQGIASGVIAGADLAIFNQISQHEDAHVTLLQNTITSLGGTPVNSPIFDFTAGGNFTPFVVYAQFLALSQAFEDTGVRAYKGQAGALMANNDVLTAALQIHSVEARHASEVRRLRTKNGLDTVKGWVTGSSRGTLPAATQAIYDGDDILVQATVNIAGINGVGNDAATEAFDEPLTQAQVLAIADLFIV
ncbi:MAG TPA: ferritin-like domain-containing protein [Chitinophagales bacterium]|nr:ferritin-like domain-containing protein [Chitinophagales bacterium]